ncbi:MAG: FHA domain-containing protein [Candidatus Aminicenantes bacterium]|nr:FHA domain-containing protein [Candidatus Aminicenantes bacterium]
MNLKIIIIIVGIFIFAGILVFILKWRNQKKQDFSEEDLSTEIEDTDVSLSPPPVIKKEKQSIGEIDIFVKDKKISTTDIMDQEIRIGRDPTKSTIIISEPIISKLHCSLITENNRVFIKDNHSTNGTYINNEKISEQELETNDIIFLGKKGTIKIIFRKKS